MENKNLIPIFEAEGTNYEIGYAVGSKAKKQVLNCIQSYKDQFEAFVGLGWEDAKKLAQQYVDVISQYNHNYIDEMQGIADGAGVTFDDILLLNCRSEVVLRSNKDATPDGCTSIAVTPRKTDGKSTLIGQNWDWKLSQRESMIIVKIKQTATGLPDLVLLTEAGIIGKYGMNSAGLGFCFNALATNDFPQGALPLHIACRGAMDSLNLCEAMTKVTRYQLGCAVNFLFASRDGVAVDIEVSNDDFDVLYPEDGIITHANHFRSLRLPRYPYKDMSKYKWPDTFIRNGRAEELMGDIKGAVSMRNFERVFADHADYPTSICHHEDPRDPQHARLGTVISFVMNLNTREMHICKGAPCETPFEVYRF
jgi:isopenicillin-N N-acyltransferase-like protein